ncbi:MAG: response regulator [Pseudomonadota bacterium]
MKAQYDKIKKQRTLILLIFAFTGLCLAAVTPLIINKINSENRTSANLQALLMLSGDIVYLDEVLTMSARMHAYTSDHSWRLRYNEHVIILDEKMAAAIAINEQIADNLKKTDQANKQLVSIESNAFALVENGKPDQAIDALTNASYLYYKQLYSKGVSDSLQLAVTKLEKTQLLLSKEIGFFTWLYVVTTVAFFILLALFICYSRKTESFNKQLLSSLQDELAVSQEAEKSLTKANYAKNRFLANISHEIKTPLNGIVGNLQLLGNENLSSRGEKIMQLLFRSSDNLNDKLSNILDVVEIESGEFLLRQERFDLNNVYLEAVTDVLDLCNKKGLVFKYQNNVTNGNRIGDAGRLLQLIMNLLNNAIKFTDAGVVALKMSQLEKELIEIEVSDTGAGISNEAMDNIYTAFSQGDISSTKPFEGLGLGLSISKAIVANMRGEIKFERNAKTGTKVTVLMRVASASDLVCGSIRDDASKRSSGELQILIAEDEYINQEVLKDMLRGLNANIAVAQNGVEACKMVNRKTSLVLMDIQMPEMDGISACKRIKRTYPKLPIIAVTANVSSQDLKNYDEAGIDSVVGKPVNKSLLLDTIAVYVETKQKSTSTSRQQQAS